MRVLATIHARKGSVRYKDKNLKEVDGLPMFLNPIVRALESHLVTDVAFSTDCPKMKSMAKSYSPRVICIDRPAELADESEGLIVRRDVLPHTIRMWRRMSGHTDPIVAMILQSVILSNTVIDRCAEVLLKHQRGTVESVKRVHHPHPEFMFRVNEEGDLTPYVSGKYIDDSQITQWQEPLWGMALGVHGRMDPPLDGPKRPVKLQWWEVVEVDETEDHYVANAMVKFVEDHKKAVKA